LSDEAGVSIRLFLVDDHPAVREGLRLLLEQHGMEVCGEASDVAGTLAAIAGTAPDLAVVDLSLGEDSGLDLLRALGRLLPSVPLLVYSMHEDAFHVQQAFAAGARGYVTKREISTQLADAVFEVLPGRRCTSPRARAALAESSSGGQNTRALSPRELVVYRLLGRGYSSHAIAVELGVSRHTVDSYFVRILEKLDAPGMEALRRRAISEKD